MIILSGLGNPGKEYNGTRHNIGFDLINCLHKHYNFPEFRKKFDGLFSKSEISRVTPIFFVKHISAIEVTSPPSEMSCKAIIFLFFTKS